MIHHISPRFLPPWPFPMIVAVPVILAALGHGNAPVTLIDAVNDVLTPHHHHLRVGMDSTLHVRKFD